MVNKVPREARRAASQLRKLPGVVGVFWGQAFRRGHWLEEPCLCVHVRWKRTRRHVKNGEVIPKRVAGFRTDVVEVAQARVHALDHTDEMVTIDSKPIRRATITAICPTDSGAVAILSGHASLPIRQGRVARAYDSEAEADVAIQVNDGAGGFYVGWLERGAISKTRDFSLTRFNIDLSGHVDEYHLALGTTPPFAVRTTELEGGEVVWHYSRLDGRRKRLRGRYRGVSGTSVELKLPDGTSMYYQGVLTVASDDTLAFSRGGDSGSLVTDSERRVVGVVLGGSGDETTSYVLPIGPLKAVLGGVNDKFFVA